MGVFLKWVWPAQMSGQTPLNTERINFLYLAKPTAWPLEEQVLDFSVTSVVEVAENENMEKHTMC